MNQQNLIVVAIVIALASVVHVVPGRQAYGESPVTISDGPQLFLDDYLVAQTNNLKRHLQKPIKHPANPLIVQDRPWEKRIMEVYGTVLYDEQNRMFRCWYLASESPTAIPDTPEAPGTAEYYQCYAESKDGIHWKKPLIGFAPFGPHKKTNVVIKGTHGFCVLPTPQDPDPSRQFKGAGGRSFGFSPDGIHWTLRKWAAVRKNDTSTSVVFWDGEFLAYVRNQERDNRPKSNLQRAVGISTSKDFISWTPKKTVFMTDEQDGYPWVQPYGLAVTPYGDQLVGLVFMLYLDKVEGNNTTGDMNVQMITSRDGRRWERVADRAVFLEGKKGDWDWRIMSPATSMFVKDDTVYIYYTGMNTRHGGLRGKSSPKFTSSIGLATLPADRFVALAPEDDSRPGLLETKPLSFEGKDLLVNAEVPKDGLQVEVLDAEDNVLPGFGREDCRLVKHDTLRYRVAWGPEGNAKSIGDTPCKMVTLRFNLKRGDLYAFQIVMTK